MSRLRWRTFTMSPVTRSVMVPNSAPWLTTHATLALHISFLLGIAVEVRARVADPPALHDRRAPAGPCQGPGEQLPVLSTAEHERVVPFWCGHTFPSGRRCFGPQPCD